jgi:outer membrane protein TolC
VDRGELEVQRFALRKIINQLFLRIQGLRAQGELFALSLADIEARAVQLRAAINQGTVLEGELSRLEVKKLELEAQQDNLAYQLEGAINSLSDWLGLTLPEDLILDFPDLSAMRLSDEIRRPELDQFEQQKALVLGQAELIDIQLKPKLSVFAQAGIGYPNPLNILDNNIAPYGLLGGGLTWTIKDWDQAQKKKDLLSLQARRIDHAAETFTFRLEKQTANYQADMARLDQQIRRQESIVRLQQQLLTEVTAQMEAGIATSTDYVLQLNAELAARQKIAILQTERQAIQLNYWNERGAF